MADTSSTLRQSIAEVMGVSTPSQFRVSIVLTNDNGTMDAYSPIEINRMTIDQQFYEKFTDDIYVNFKIASRDYHTLYVNRQGLRATLTLSFTDVMGYPSKASTPIVKQYVATLVDPKDMSKSTPDLQHRVVPDMELTLKLFDSDAYRLRHQGISGIYHDTQLPVVLGHILNTYGIAKSHIAPGVNTHTFPHVVVPGLHEFSTVFGYLQKYYGVYDLGLASYITDSTLWIFPPFDTNPVYPTHLRVYQAIVGAYAGAPSYHRQMDDTTLSIVLNNMPQVNDHAYRDSEHAGTAAMILRASPEIDGIVSQNSGVLTYNQDSSMIIRRSNPNLVEPDKHFVRYLGQTDNIQQVTSHLAAKQYVEASIQWSMAIPFKITPGQATTYFHDENGVTKSRTGQVRRIHYDITRASNGGRRSGTVVHQCHASVVLHLDPNEQTV